LAGIRNSDTFTTDDKGTKITLDNATTFSINNTGGTFVNNSANNADAVVIETNNGINISGGSMTNQSIIIMNGPFNASQGVANGLTNQGFISDANGSLLDVFNNVPTRTLDDVLQNVGQGLLVAPYHAVCRESVITDYLITSPAFDPNTATFLPVANWTMGGTPAATLDVATNTLTLSTGINIMTLDFEVLAGGTSCNVFGQTNFTFDNGNAAPLVCNSNVQISLDVNCIAKILPDMILEADGGCMNGFTVEILSGSRAGTDHLDATYLGTTVDVMVTDPSGLICFWGKVTV